MSAIKRLFQNHVSGFFFHAFKQAFPIDLPDGCGHLLGGAARSGERHGIGVMAYKRKGGPGPRAGFSLVEVIVSVALIDLVGWPEPDSGTGYGAPYVRP